VKASTTLTKEQEQTFREGVPVHGKRTAPAGLKLLQRGDSPWYEVKLIEGRQNQIKLMFRHFGVLVEKLKRVRVGFLELGPLKPGTFRHLTEDEVARFQRLLSRRKPAVKKTAAKETKEQ
jgi:23S rRNA pseudouridine2605 synthase